jgi:alkanesulfonate monooxygenase SsuD/methylene tetrahydromethanopterin reductase-like flavin-dependent oxidoreductase (luciferase family)
VPDFGHPLRFGVFITPTTAPADKPVALATAAEDLGFDLATFQDHPYQSGFADTWTLLTFIAARTERIGLAGNVINLPLRQPAVLARAAASLDRLTGGRIAMGLGAGAFWDAVEAMGGPRRTPGQAVTALGEAIDIIRGIWDVADRSRLAVDGEHYRVAGPKRGPAPAHAIPLWLGAYGPRMLRLIGRKADGWLPSLSYLKSGDLARGNAVIDDAAARAGRDPAEITRLLNVGPDLSVDDAVAYARDDGISVFIVAADDEPTMRYWAESVIPAIRDRVTAARTQGGTVVRDRIRSAAALSKRRDNIDYDGVPESLAARAVEPGDPAWARYQSSYMRGGSPGLVLRPHTAAEVVDAVRFAGRHREVPLGIFSAGHGISGRSINDGGLVVDVGAIRHVEVIDAASGRVRVGPGARWVDVAKALAPHGLAITSGDYGGVGVGGLTVGGGIGYLAREHGLTIDQLTAVEVVLADGTLARADATTEPDLFWAMRGAGANFGVAVDFEFTAAHVGKVGFAQLVFDATDTAGFLQRWGEAIEAADRIVSGEVILGRAQGGARYARAILLVDSDDPDRVIAALQPIAGVAPLVDQSVAIAGYDEILAAFTSDAPQQGQGDPRSHSGLARHLDGLLTAEAAAMLDAGASYFFQIRSVGGAVADVPAEDTAYGWRDANFSIAAMGTRHSGLDEYWQRLLPHLQGLYLNFETDTGPDVLTRAFPPAHLARLRRLKARYDPSGLLRDNLFIPPG